MALQGTLDTFALPDVLHLLAATRKTGCLRLTGSRGAGTVTVSDGAIVDVAAEHAPRSVEPEAALFELLRFVDGSFLFDAEAAVTPGEVHDVDGLLAGAEALLAEWREIESVVPSLRAWVRLRAELDADTVTVSGAQWPTIVAVGTGTTVEGLGERLDLAELPVSRAVRDLVELGVAEIEDRPASAAASEAAAVDVAPVHAEPAVPASVETPEALVEEPASTISATAALSTVEAALTATIDVEPSRADVPEAVAPTLDEDADPSADRTEAEHWAEFWGEGSDAAEAATPHPGAADEEALPTARPIKARRPRPRSYEGVGDAEERFVPLDLPGHMASPAVSSAETDPVDDDAVGTDELDDDLAQAFPGLSGRAGSAPLGLIGEDDDPVDADAESEDGRDEAPISRGLLLKFLGSKS